MFGKLATAAAEAANRLEFLMKCRRETGDVFVSMLFFMMLCFSGAGCVCSIQDSIFFHAADPVFCHLFRWRDFKRSDNAESCLSPVR